MKILIIQTAFTGDVILATPLIEKLHRHDPHAVIDFLLKQGNEGLLTGHPHLRNVILFRKKEGKVKQIRSLLRAIRAEKYDLVINLHRFLSSGILTAFSGARRKVGFDKNPLSYFFTRRVKHRINEQVNGKFVHEIERNLALIGDLTEVGPERPALYPAAADFEKVKQDRPYVCMAPASVWFTKQFPEQKWVELIQQLPEGYAIKLIGGPGDKDLCERIREQSGHTGAEVLAGTLSYLESAALMKHAAMNFVNDSAPLHMASAMNAPVASIFCSTVPAFGFTGVSDRTITIETQEKLSCRPCGLHGHKACPQGHFKCAAIEVQTILKLTGLG